LIPFNHKIKYLGVIIDENSNFTEHTNYMIRKINKYYNMFRALYGNSYGYDFKNRLILYKGIFEAIISYCSIIYYPRLNKKSKKKILSLQRRILIGIAAGYRTISYAAIGAVTGVMPIDLKLQMINEIKDLKLNKRTKQAQSTISDYFPPSQLKKEIESNKKVDKNQMNNKEKFIKEKFLDLWSERYVIAHQGRHTYSLIPDLSKRLKTNIEINYYITQAFTGHGKCASYLKKFAIVDDDTCRECGEITDSMRHTIFECPVFSEIRSKIKLPLYEDASGQRERGIGGLERDELSDFCKFLVEVLVKKKDIS